MAPELAMLKLQKKKTDTMTAAQATIFNLFFFAQICSIRQNVTVSGNNFYFIFFRFFLLKLQKKKTDTMSAAQAMICIPMMKNSSQNSGP